MDKNSQLQEEAKRQVFAACELLFKRGAKTLRDFSVRKIREVKLELFGVGGKFSTIPAIRDEWMKQAGLLNDESMQNEPSKQGGSIEKNPQLESEFYNFVQQQAIKLAGKEKVDLENKVADQNKEIEKLKALLEEKDKEIKGVKQLSGGLGDALTSIAESKADLIVEKKKNNELEEKLSKALIESETLRDDLKVLTDKLKKKEKSSLVNEEKLAKFYNKFSAMEGEVKAIEANKAILEKQYRSALQDLSLAEKELKWFKNKEKEQRDELSQNLYYANKIISKLGDN